MNKSDNKDLTQKLDHLRMMFWPINNSELKKFLPLAFIMICVLFNYSILRGLKDSLVVPGIGAEAIPFLKSYIVLPCAIFFVFGYMALLNKYNEERSYYIVSSVFISFFALFAFVLYPNEHAIHPAIDEVKKLAEEYPRLKWFIFLYGKWLYAVMYVFAELWGSIMLSLLFWQFANKITTTTEAKRFYSMFGLIGNFGLLAAGTVMKMFSVPDSDKASLTSLVDSSQSMVSNILSMVIAATVISVFIYKWMNKNVLTDKNYYIPEVKIKSKKPKLSIKESLNLIFHSKYLGLIAMLILCYGVSINLVEGPWKAKLRELYPTKQAYLYYWGGFTQWMGLASIMFYLIGSNILRLFKWCTAAMITPIIIFITGVGFFCFSIYQDKFVEISYILFGVSPLVIAVFLGMMQNVLSKATKYSLFDSTKEMAYIPIDNELKTKGKAAVDVIGGRFGKSGGAIIQSLLLFIFPHTTLEILSPYLMVIFMAMVVLWIFAVKRLATEYNKFVQE
jgi:AAA family ATP:ADP antiporter